MAPLVLLAMFVGLPFILGVLSGRPTVTATDLTLLGALYVGFIARILLNDFRDVVGDAMFGKRTFLVRHGRRATCALSVGCWTLGTALLVGATPARSTVFIAAECTLSAVAIALVVRLGRPLSHRTEERVISAVAMLGRAVVTVLFFHLSATHPVFTDR